MDPEGGSKALAAPRGPPSSYSTPLSMDQGTQGDRGARRDNPREAWWSQASRSRECTENINSIVSPRENLSCAIKKYNYYNLRIVKKKYLQYNEVYIRR